MSAAAATAKSARSALYGISYIRSTGARAAATTSGSLAVDRPVAAASSRRFGVTTVAPP